MSVADQTTAGVDRNFEIDFPANMLAAHLRQRRRAAYCQLSAFSALGEAEDFVSDNLSNRETVVHFRALHVARLPVCHRERIRRGFARRRECRSVFLCEREIISRVTKAEQARGLRFVAADPFQVFLRTE